MATCTFAAGTADTDNTPNTSGSFTPAVGDLLVVFVAGTATVVDGQLTSSVGGFTFTQFSRAIWAASSHSLCGFVSDALVSSAVSQTVTAAFSGDEANGTTIMVYRVSGITKTGLAAVRQSAKQDNQLAATTPGPTFGVACLTGNPVLGALANNRNPAAVTQPAGGWSEDLDTGYSTPSAGSQCVHIDSGFTGTTVTWGSTYGANGCAMVVEIDASSNANKGGFGLMGMGR